MLFVNLKTLYVRFQTTFKNDVAFRVSQNLIVRKHIIVAWTFNSVCSMLQQATRLNVQSQILVRERLNCEEKSLSEQQQDKLMKYL